MEQYYFVRPFLPFRMIVFTRWQHLVPDDLFPIIRVLLKALFILYLLRLTVTAAHVGSAAICTSQKLIFVIPKA